MRIAILGATSQIAKDLILSFAEHSQHELVLYARRPEAVTQWLAQENLAHRYTATDFEVFSNNEQYDALLNFVGVGNPAQAAALGASIFDVTLKFDELALSYVHQHPTCRYIFLSSGAAYGSNFESPADANTKAMIDINNLQAQDWYGVAKLHAECRHRSLAHLPIVDVRVFNYFSHTQDMSARFLITDIIRAVRDKLVLRTSADLIIRDYLHPTDFSMLTSLLLAAAPTNTVVDCYSQAPVDKLTLLSAMRDKFGLRFQVVDAGVAVNATGSKPNYFVVNRAAERFGYAPGYTSLMGVLLEAELALVRNFRTVIMR